MFGAISFDRSFNRASHCVSTLFNWKTRNKLQVARGRSATEHRALQDLSDAKLRNFSRTAPAKRSVGGCSPQARNLMCGFAPESRH
jgi:hypothetical protein